jgi:hypothetical protein
VEDQAAAKAVQAQLEEEEKEKEREKENHRVNLDMHSRQSRRERDKRKSIFLSMSIDSRVALPDELIITKQKIPSVNTGHGNKSLLGREIRAGDNLRGIDLNQLLSDDEDDSSPSLDSDSSFIRGTQQQQVDNNSDVSSSSSSSSSNASGGRQRLLTSTQGLQQLTEREILDKIDQLHSNGGEDAMSGPGAPGSAELSGYRVTEVLLMPKGSLNLAYRGLGSLGDDLFQLPMLTHLDLKGNSVSVIPPEVSRLVSLATLDLSRYTK